jgi:hypothetical protein
LSSLHKHDVPGASRLFKQPSGLNRIDASGCK